MDSPRPEYRVTRASVEEVFVLTEPFDEDEVPLSRVWSVLLELIRR